MSCPSNHSSPAVSGMRRASVANSVLLPAPLAPSTANTSGPTLRSRPLITVTPLYPLRIPLASNTAFTQVLLHHGCVLPDPGRVSLGDDAPRSPELCEDA